MNRSNNRVRANVVASILLFSGIFVLMFSCDDSTSTNGDHAGNQNYTASENFSYMYGVASKTTIRLESITGSVEVTGRAGIDSISMSGERRVKSDSQADAEEHLVYLEIVIIESNDEIIIRTEQPDDAQGRGYEVDYFIDIPSNWEVVIDHITGNVSVEDIDAAIDIDTITGNMACTDCTGNIRADLTTGNMTFSDIRANIDGDLTTGNIDCAMILPEGGECNLELVTGSMYLSIPQTTSAMLTADVTTGSIVITNLELNNADVSDTHVTGMLGDGNGTINLDLVTGNIYIQGY